MPSFDASEASRRSTSSLGDLCALTRPACSGTMWHRIRCHFGDKTGAETLVTGSGTRELGRLRKRYGENAEFVSYEYSGCGYFLTVRHPAIPLERIGCDKPSVSGLGRGIRAGFLVFIENGQIMHGRLSLVMFRTARRGRNSYAEWNLSLRRIELEFGWRSRFGNRLQLHALPSIRRAVGV